MKLRVGNINIDVWLITRIAVVMTGALSAQSFVPGPASPFAGGSILLLLVFFGFGVIAMLFVVGLQAFNSRSAVLWIKPDWRLNPFSLKQPLQFFHMMGFYFIVSGIAASTLTLLMHLSGLEPFIPIALGAGTLFGVKCCIVLFRWKFLPKP
jgi:hypothetical protein